MQIYMIRQTRSNTLSKMKVEEDGLRMIMSIIIKMIVQAQTPKMLMEMRQLIHSLILHYLRMRNLILLII